MRNLYLLITTVVMCSFLQKTEAQPTWSVGATTLTEFDLVTGVNLPWEILWGPDDHMWATLRSGQVIRIDPISGTYTQVLDIEVMNDGSGEPGMLGMTMHPDWENTPKVFVVYNTGSAWSGTEFLSAFTWDGTNLVDEEVLLDNIDAGGIHNGSRLIITPDNKIMMTTGDTGDGGDSSQDINAMNGKVLRINLDGSIPTDNPDPESYVYSWGHRNAQGLCNGPNGLIYSSEHGQSNSDEFNIIEAGRNYGWPNVEGVCNTASEIAFCDVNNVKEPLEEWSPCVAVNGIEYYNHPAIPDWQNCVLMSVLGGLGGTYERLSVLHMNADGTSINGEEMFFAEFNQRIRDVCINPYTGAVYLAFNGPGYPGNGPNIIKEFRNMDYVGVSETATPIQSIEIYPNPSDSDVILKFSDQFLGTNYSIFGYNGQVVDSQILDSTTLTLKAGNLAPGQYYVRASSQHGTISKSFVIQ